MAKVHFKQNVRYINAMGVEHATELVIYDYTPPSFVLTSSEDFGQSFKEVFESCNGKFNRKLSVGKGWVFSKKQLGKFNDIIRAIEAGIIKAQPYVSYTKVPSPYSEASAGVGVEVPSLSVADLVRNLFMRFASTTEPQTTYLDDNTIAIIGEESAVMPLGVTKMEIRADGKKLMVISLPTT
jgi:hypothetical protein